MAPALARMQNNCARQLASLLDGDSAAVCLAEDEECDATIAECTKLV